MSISEDDLKKFMKDMHWENREARIYLNQIKRYDFYKDFGNSILRKQFTFNETLKYIKKNKVSFSRFGDGEFGLMLKNGFNLAFQPQSGQLMERLHDVLDNPVDSLLIGMPNLFDDERYFGVYSNYLPKMLHLLEKHKYFGNSHVSRPVYFELYKDEAVENWRNLWDDLSVTFVTGKNSRFEYRPELFNNIKSYDFYETLPVNAFSNYEQILNDLKENNSDLILMSLGPTATILAYDLAKAGKWAIDIGHITNSFDNKIKGTGAWPESMQVTRK